MLISLSLGVASTFDFKGDKSCQQGCWIELTNNCFNVGETAREGVQRHDVSIAHRCQGHEAEINQVAGDEEIVFARIQANEGFLPE